MRNTSSSTTSQMTLLWQSVWRDLLPFEGRFAITWRVAIVCSLTAMMFMTYGVPLVSIGCYLIMYLGKPTAQENMLTAVAISVLISLLVPVLLWLAAASINDPLWRLVIIVLGTYIFVLIGAATPLGEQGNIVGLVIAFAVTLLPMTPLGEMVTRGILYAWLMVLIPMGVMFVFHLFAGRSCRKLLDVAIAEKLELVAQALSERLDIHGPRQRTLQAKIRKQLLEGINEANNLLKLTQLFHLLPKAQSQAMRHAINNLEAILVLLYQSSEQELTQDSKPSILNIDTPNPFISNTLGQLEAICRDLAQPIGQHDLGQTVMTHRQLYLNKTVPEEDTHLPDDLRQIQRRIWRLFDDNTAQSVSAPGPKTKTPNPLKGFVKEDAWRNPEYSQQAIKTTIAATLAYMIYTVIDWDGIHTAMITCYVVSLGSTGETVHKLTLRIVGCLIGAALGIASITWLMPQMTSIGELMLLVFVGVLFAAWISSGSERISYGGIQVGLAFLMTVLQGFGPAVDISVATDRIYGILLGNFLMFVIFTRIWPVSVITTISRQMREIIRKLQALQQSDQPLHDRVQANQRRTQINEILVALDQAHDSLSYNHFEPKRLQLTPSELARWRQTLVQLESLILQYARNELIIVENLHGVQMEMHQEISVTLAHAQNLLNTLTQNESTGTSFQEAS